MIGTETLAQTIAAIEWADRENVDCDIALDSMGDIPEGWEYIASGGFRHCFRGPDGNVYKVHTAYARKYGSHENEENTRFGMDIAAIAESHGVRVARTDYFSDCNVQVQEWIEGEQLWPDDHGFYDVVDVIQRMWKTLGQRFDVHGGNFLIVDNTPVLIDW